MFIYAHTITKSGICATIFLKHYLQIPDTGNTKGRGRGIHTHIQMYQHLMKHP